MTYGLKKYILIKKTLPFLHPAMLFPMGEHELSPLFNLTTNAKQESPSRPGWQNFRAALLYLHAVPYIHSFRKGQSLSVHSDRCL